MSRCWRELRGWARAFTRRERLLVSLEAVSLLALLVASASLASHLLASCSARVPRATTVSTAATSTAEFVIIVDPPTDNTTRSTARSDATVPRDYSSTKRKKIIVAVDPRLDDGPGATATDSETFDARHDSSTKRSKIIVVHPGLDFGTRSTATDSETFDSRHYPSTERGERPRTSRRTRRTASGLDPFAAAPDASDGEYVDGDEFSFVVALVRVRPGGIALGCVLSAITPQWTVTAASCLEAAEEVDSLEAYAVMEGFGRGGGRALAVRDVAVHPGRGAAGGPDLALVRAAGRLRARPAALASRLDHRRLALGDGIQMLGFGPFRSVEASGSRPLRAAALVRLPLAACGGGGGEVAGGEGAGAGGGGGGEPRHLRPLAAAPHARCAAAPLCAGVLFARGAPCQYCAGAALVWRGRLAGVAGDAGDGGCGAACEPARAPRLAAHRAWLAAATANALGPGEGDGEDDGDYEEP